MAADLFYPSSGAPLPVIAPAAPAKSGVRKFRLKLLGVMMLVISVITTLALYFAQRQLAASVEQDLKREFQTEIASLNSVLELRHATLAERCRSLAQNARLHAALEDDALDLLYPSAKDELRDMMDHGLEDTHQRTARSLHATF